MLRFTRHGFWEIILGTLLLSAVSFGLSFIWHPLMWIVWPFWIWLLAFFRDPERPIPSGNIMVSPADGMVSDITEQPHNDLLGEPCVRVGIFLSVFNVHVNRSPCDGKVTNLIYKHGKFINALHHNEASEQNESNTLLLSDPTTGKPVAVVKQIVGLIARRIVCVPKVGDTLSRGQRIGMIKFGSRTELYIPIRLQPKIEVSVGQKVRGAADVIATLGTS